MSLQSGAQTAVVDAAQQGTEAAEPAFKSTPIRLILPSRDNPRKTFDAAKLTELATTIASLGVMQPILVRPLPASRLEETAGMKPRPVYEIVAGERRWRASQEAGLKEIPAYIRDLTDAQVPEARMVENLQRDDLHPLEEADGYQRLIDATGISKDEVGTKIGKSRSYVYNRLKLLTLAQESRDAFRDGKLDASKAELLATVGDTKLQAKALKEFIATDYAGRSKSVRECRDWLQQNILLRIKDAPFDTKDETLAACGACTGCPKRTHADRDIFAAFEGPDMCTDPPCYHGKEEAHLERIRAEAAAKGMEVIAGKEARKLRPHDYYQAITGYTRLDAKHDDGNGGEATLSKLLGKDAPTPVLFVDPHTHQRVKVLPTDVVGKLLKDKGLVKDTAADQVRKSKAAAEREREKRELEEQHRWLTIETISERIRDGAITAFAPAVLRIMAAALLVADDEESDADTVNTLLKLWHLPDGGGDSYDGSRARHETVRRHIQASPEVLLGQMVLQVLIARETRLERQDPHTYAWTNDTPAINALAEETGVDAAAILADLKADHAQRKRDAKVTKKGAETPAAIASAAPPGISEATSADAPASTPARKARRTKVSAAEAQQGIADAMQSVTKEPGDVAGLQVQAAWPPHLSKMEIGSQVRVSLTVPKPKAKWKGEQGELVEVDLDAGIYRVQFTGQAKAVGFDRADLEAVQA